MASKYVEMLKDPRWQKKRLEILSRSDFSCEWCDSKDKTLHVHHTIYYKNAAPWEYENCVLLSLCEDCHQEWHKLKTEIDIRIALMNSDELERMMDFSDLLINGKVAEVIIKKSAA